MSTTAIKGLPSGEFILAMDFTPATGEFYVVPIIADFILLIQHREQHE
jgi:hypothetical protein